MDVLLLSRTVLGKQGPVPETLPWFAWTLQRSSVSGSWKASLQLWATLAH